MKVIYRLSPFMPDNPPEFFGSNKWEMVDACHESFMKAGGDKYQKIYIIDSCEDWNTHFKLYGEVININTKTKVDSLLTAYDVAAKLNDKVLFLEDDYIWRPNTLPKLERALDEFALVSPYDHPAHYIEDRFDKKFELRLLDGVVYRTCPSNTHTFATNSKFLNEHWDIFVKNGVNDHNMFTELSLFEKLWAPTHSFATHLATGCLAPNVEWRDFLKTS